MAMNIPMAQEDELQDFSACVQHESWSRHQLSSYQERALQTCREYAYAHSPFYQRFHRGLTERPLHELPVLTKAMMMEHFDELVTDHTIRLQDAQQYLAHADTSKPFLDRYRVLATSGSSGQPGVFLYDRVEGASVGNSYTRCTYWGGITSESRAAVVASTAPAHMTSRAPITVNGQPVARLQLSTNEPLETLVECLNEWQPNALFLYPSIAGVLADEQRQGRLRVTPRIIFCGSETMPSETRQKIEEVWQTRLFDIYGTTEGGVLAAECSFHQGLHMFEDFSIVEVVDQDNRPVPPGEQGDKVLITVLFRHTQPLIRYELADLVRASSIERCACGRPFALLEAIEGRAIEVLHLPSPSGRDEKIYPYLFTTIFNTQPVSGWQVIHEADGLHVFLTGASEQLRDEPLLDALRQALIKRGVIVPPITIQRVQTLTKNAGGKMPTVISRVPHR
jgi:putative adenylate-forming enzyme